VFPLLNTTKITGPILVNPIIRYDNNYYVLYRPNISQSFIKISPCVVVRQRTGGESTYVTCPASGTIGACHHIGIFTKTRPGTQFIAVGADSSIRAKWPFRGTIQPSQANRKQKKQLDFCAGSVSFHSLSHEKSAARFPAIAAPRTHRFAVNNL
jgi:hypothetical protein